MSIEFEKFQKKRDPKVSCVFKKWLGWLDSNQRIPESKSGALPLGDSPISTNKNNYSKFNEMCQQFFFKKI